MRIGIDLGGSKIEGIALDSGGEERARKRIPAPRGDYARTVQAVVGLVLDLERQVGTKGSVGVGIPGTLSSQTGKIKNANSTWLIGHTLDKDLSATLERPVRLANDANCFALSEATDGAGTGVGVVFGVILGSGVGGGIVVDGAPLTGVNAIGGEWGHNPLPWATGAEQPGVACYCGQRGCIETFLCGDGLRRTYAEICTGIFGDPATPISAAEIASAAKSGDAKAEESIVLYADRLARGLASVINIVDPDVIVLGGGLSNISTLYDLVPGKWHQWIFSDHVQTHLRPNRHGDSSGVRGAAWLWPDSAGIGAGNND